MEPTSSKTRIRACLPQELANLQIYAFTNSPLKGVKNLSPDFGLFGMKIIYSWLIG
jgi:hypothetical protein